MKYIIALLACATFAFAQLSTEGKSTAAVEETTPKVAAPAFANLEPKDWVGEEFIILPLKKSDRVYGYNHLRSPVGGYIVPTYEEVAGKTGTVTEVNIPGRGDWQVVLKLHDEDKIVTAVSSLGSFPNLARKADFDAARAQWVGDTIWVVGNTINYYDEKNDKVNSVTVLKYSPVIVESIEPGWDHNYPLRLHVHTYNGEHGYVDVRVSNTNVAKEKIETYHFEEIVLVTNPRVTHNWPEETWTAIGEGRVVKGMTAEQVEMSWGEPDEVVSRFNENEPNVIVSETWSYGTTALRFEKGVLVHFAE